MTSNEHHWGSVPPGQGRNTDQVCRKCGQRRSAVLPDVSCPGVDPETSAETTHAYDPYA